MEAQNVKPDIERGLLQTSILAAHGFYPEALTLLIRAEEDFKPRHDEFWTARRGQLDYRHEIDVLKSKIEQDLQQHTGKHLLQ